MAILRNKLELMQLLKYYDQYLDNEGKDYLISLINLEIFAYHYTELSKYNKIYLKRLSIYREAIIYNIINKIKREFEREDLEDKYGYDICTLEKQIDFSAISILEILYDFSVKDEDFGVLNIFNFKEYNSKELREIDDKIRNLKFQNEISKRFSNMYERISNEEKLNKLVKQREEMNKIPNNYLKKDKIEELNILFSQICDYINIDVANKNDIGIKIMAITKKV